jgi:hypothetical protein
MFHHTPQSSNSQAEDTLSTKGSSICHHYHLLKGILLHLKSLTLINYQLVRLFYIPNTIETITMEAIIPTTSAKRPTFNASLIFLIPTAPK